MNNVKKKFAKRLKEAMTQAGYEPKPAVLEREFNLRYLGSSVTLHGVRRWLLGETLPSPDKMLVLAKWLNIEPHVLRDGEEASVGIKETRQSWDVGLDHREREIIEVFLQLPVAEKKIVREVILAFAKK